MDAALLHARNLMEFLTQLSGGHDLSVVDLGLADPLDSPTCDGWREPLNRHVMHLSAGRSSPTNTSAGVHLNEEVERLAVEVLRLWDKLGTDAAVTDIASELTAAHNTRTLADAANDAASLEARLGWSCQSRPSCLTS